MNLLLPIAAKILYFITFSNRFHEIYRKIDLIILLSITIVSIHSLLIHVNNAILTYDIYQLRTPNFFMKIWVGGLFCFNKNYLNFIKIIIINLLK